MINIQDIIPFMKKGWVAMDGSGRWWKYSKKPIKDKDLLQWLPHNDGSYCCINNAFDIAPADDWAKSLIKVGGK